MRKNIKNVSVENKLSDIDLEDVKEYIGESPERQKFYGAKCGGCNCGHCGGDCSGSCGGCGDCGSSCSGGCKYSNK